MDDKTALENMRQGGKVGFETLYKRYFPKLRSGVLRLLTKYGDSKQMLDIVDEICQETFCSFHQNIHTFKEECSVMTWLSKLAYHKTIDYWRKEQTEYPKNWLFNKMLSRKPVFKEELSLEEETEETFLRMSIETTEQEEKKFCYAECIGNALKRLGPNDPDCLTALIFSFPKPSIDKIANEIGITHQDAKLLLNRCKRKFKESPNCLMALMLFYALELSQKELAKILDKKENAIGVFLYDCRQKLKNDANSRSCCEECGYLLPKRQK